VTTDQLLAVLNEDAARLSIRPVKRRLLRYWVDEGLIAARTAKGRKRGKNPIWQFSEDDVLLARRIVELKAENINRASELRIHLWVSANNYPIHSVKEALHCEFSRLMSRNRRNHPVRYDHRNRQRLSEIERKSFIRQLPPLDPDLANLGFAIPRDDMLEISSELVWGKAGEEKSPKLIGKEVTRIIAKCVGVGLEQRMIFENLAGVFGAMDEIGGSGQQQLGHVQDEDMREGRRRFIDITLALPILPSLCRNSDAQTDISAIALRKQYESFKTTEWIVPTLAAFVVQAFRERTDAKDRPSAP
jgi:DNA-binding transcriptional MerR regulator